MNSLNKQHTPNPTLTVVESIAEKENVRPVDLSPTLHEVVNTEALNRIVESMDSSSTVQFQYKEYEVTVDSSGDVDVSEKLTV